MKLKSSLPSKILVSCKRNANIGELHRAKKIACNFDIEIKRTVNKYTVAGFSSRFIHSTKDNFNDVKMISKCSKGCLKKGRHSRFAYRFPLVMRILRKFLSTSVTLLEQHTHGKYNNCFH